MLDSGSFLICCEHYTPSVGGVQEVMRQVATRLAKRGHRVTVATSSHPVRPSDAVIDGVRVVSFPVSGNMVRGITGPVDAYRGLLLDGGFDAVLIKAAHQWTFDASIELLSRLRCRKYFIPCGFHLRDPRFADYYSQMPAWLAEFDGLIFYSATYQDILFARSHGLDRIHLLPNGADEREFSTLDSGGVRDRLGIPADDELILSVGSQIPAKGHWDLMRAYCEASFSSPSTLVINANDPVRHRVARFLRDARNIMHGYLPLRSSARLYNRGKPDRRLRVVDLPRADLVSLYKEADAFVLASHVEYSPLVLFEAIAAGTPFLCTDVGNAREIARWTGGGRIVEGEHYAHMARYYRVDVLTRALSAFMNDRSGRLSMGVSGRASFLRGDFQWRNIVERYAQLLETGEVRRSSECRDSAGL